MTQIPGKRFCGLLLVAGYVLIGAPQTGQAFAQPAPSKQENDRRKTGPIIRLKLHPARIERPALKYSLLPRFLDQTTGNAATTYFRAMLHFRQSGFDSTRKKISEWMADPHLTLPWDDVRKELLKVQFVLKEAESAARCERCDWGLPVRANRDVLSLSLDEIQQTRLSVAWILALQARVQIHDGKFEEAVQSLKCIFALGRHVAQVPLLIAGLVGVADAEVGTKCLLEFVQAPHSPNLYWPLSAFPQPFVDLRPAAEVELALLYQICPYLKDVEKTQRSPEEWQRLLEEFMHDIRQWFSPEHYLSSWGKYESKLSITALAAISYPGAKEHLLRKGRTLKEVEQMPVAQVLLIHMTDTYDDAGQEFAKWYSVPFSEFQAGMQKADENIYRLRNERILASLPAMLLIPALPNASLSASRVDLQIAELRVIEAVRDYAATHNRRLPAKLSDITSIPIPLQPLSGQPFDYRLEGTTAVLQVTLPRSLSQYNKRYELTIAP